MADMAPFYPMARRRRRRRWRGWARRAAAVPRGRWAAVAVLAAAALAAAIGWHGRQPDPQGAYQEGLAALREGRLADARARLAAALPAEPARAAVALARVAIERGDGAAAEIALQRAVAAGYPPWRLHALRAAARLLADDPYGAFDELRQVPPSPIGLADRIQARALAASGDGEAGLSVLAGVVARRPRDAAAWSDLGRMRLAAGDVAGASQATARALALDGGAPATLTLEGQLVRSRYGLAASLPWFEAALRRDPAFVPALAEQAATLGDMGRARAATAAARAVLAQRPGDPRAFYVLATVAARAGRPALTRRLLQRVDADAMPGALLLAGWAEQADGHPDLAVARWQQLLDDQPRNRVVRRLLAAALLRTGDAQGALDTAESVVTRGDADGETLELAARAARLLGRLNLAAALHDRAIGDRRGPSGVFAEPDTVATLRAAARQGPDAQVALVRGLLMAGDRRAAFAEAGALARAAPGVAAAQLVPGDALMLAGHGAEATAAYARAADLAFDEPTMLRLIDALARGGRRRDAATTVALYLAQNPASLAGRRIAGRWQAVAGNAGALATLARLAVATGGREAAVLADLAVVLDRAGDRDRALRVARAAYRLAPLRLDVIQAYALALAGAGDAEGAHQLRVKAAALARAPG